MDSALRWVFGYEDKRSSGQKVVDRLFESSVQIEQFLKDNPDTHWIDIRNGAKQNISLQQGNTLGVATTITVETKDRPVALYQDYSESGEDDTLRGINSLFLNSIPKGSTMRRQFQHPLIKPSYEVKSYSEHFDRSGNRIHVKGSERPEFMLSEYEKGVVLSDKTKILEIGPVDANAKKILRQAATREQLAALAKALNRGEDPDVKKHPHRNALQDRGDELLLNQWLIGSDDYLAKLIEQRRDKVGNEQLKAIEYRVIDYDNYSVSDLEPRFEPNMKGSVSSPYQVGSKLVIPIPSKGVRAGLFPSPQYFQRLFVDAGISKGTSVPIPPLDTGVDVDAAILADTQTTQNHSEHSRFGNPANIEYKEQ